MKKNNRVYFFIFVLFIIFIAEWIGAKTFKIGEISITLLPLVFAVLLTMIIGIPLWRKGILKEIYSKSNIEFSGKHLIFVMLPLMARYGADVAPNINKILKLGWIFLLQSVGNIGTVILGLPIALLLGLNREAIGATLGIGREGELAYTSEKFGLNSDEGKGILSIYLIGTLFGSIIFSFLPPILAVFGFDYQALAIGSGVGSASMMTAASSAIVAMHPNDSNTILSYAAASQLVTSFMGTYVMVFLSVPLMNFGFKLFKKERAIN